MTINQNPRPEGRELSIMNLEAEQERLERAREGEREATPEKWDRMNAESIARGDGELPF